MIRLSYSTLNLLNTCERKFQLEKLLDPFSEITETETSPKFIMGHAFEAGCVEYFLSQNEQTAIFKAWMRWHSYTECDGYTFPQDPVRSFYICHTFLKKAFITISDLLMDHEIAIFHGKPAIQLSFRINIDKTYYYVGYVDIILRNIYTKKYSVWDFKTTSLNLHDLSPIYLNSVQLVSYSTILDAIVGEEYTSYDVSYFVASIKSAEKTVKIYTFEKSLKDRLDFFITLGFDISRMEQMKTLGIYPKREKGCYSFNQPCFYLGVCSLHSIDTKQKTEEEDTTEYQFVFEMDDLIQSHVSRIAKEK